MASSQPMHVIRIKAAGLTRPFGDERTVNQAFPAAMSTSESDPFLMCDFFSMPSDGISEDPDYFPVDWHPHRGMDILSYIKTGVGRHGDSMGNRESFATPGMQWISCGSGIEHAEAGGTPEGEDMTGFQIWINVPSSRKMDDPCYGTEPPDAIAPIEVASGATARLLSGTSAGLGAASTQGSVGPMQAQCSIQMADFEMSAGSMVPHELPLELDTCILYAYSGSGTVNGAALPPGSVALLDASNANARRFEVTAAPSGLHFMLFAGTKLKEPIAWRGPIVMNTDQELMECFQELRSGRFPPKRVAWDYKRIATKPKA